MTKEELIQKLNMKPLAGGNIDNANIALKYIFLKLESIFIFH